MMAEQTKEKRSRSSRNNSAPYLCEALPFSAKEAYKRLRTNLLFSLADENSCHVIGITSSQPTEGKSVTSINLAYAIAQMGKKVLLIDADMRKSSINVRLGMDLSPGLSNLLTNVNNAGEAVRKYIPSDSSLPFSAITAGDTPPNPSELLTSERMERLLAKLRTLYDYIVIDLPPVAAVTDAQMTSSLVDGMLVVLRQSHTEVSVLNECISQLGMTKAKILGFVLNGATASDRRSSYSK